MGVPKLRCRGLLNFFVTKNDNATQTLIFLQYKYLEKKVKWHNNVYVIENVTLFELLAHLEKDLNQNKMLWTPAK